MYFKISSANNPNNLFNRINNFCTTSKHFFKTHYDVLNLGRDCTSKEVKDAFIKLSKQYHPDTANRTASQKDFVRILEAYNVLSKPHLRRDYDLGLIKSVNNIKTNSPNAYYESFGERPMRDPSFWEHRDKSQDKYYEDRPYYGIKGLKRVPNVTIVLVCLLFAAIGVSLQVIAIKKSMTFRREEIIRRSIETQEALNDVRRDAVRYGNHIQLQRLKQRMEQQNLIPKEVVDKKD